MYQVSQEWEEGTSDLADFADPATPHIHSSDVKRDFWKFLQERKGYVENNPEPGFPLAKYQDGIVDAGGELFQKAHP
ncbi:hypothetical protein PPTG_24706 [Phytophthora nicotianae INRA-310]|uniref:Uncharacterized protein n=2 Tax=Phytophthora nicotianae TaxID=4792 RepID=W2PDT3_PHYN3|nr:hypothetical protein PPTG_24706 [Phytophthora nicotianae INRA-310]ETM98184.1 hypothetical protein PPTG_24706 [Phytophthora nicotianae INRA-310]